MKSNKKLAWAIILLTALVPFRLGFLNDGEANMGFKILMMVLTMGGVIAALFVGLSNAGETKHD